MKQPKQTGPFKDRKIGERCAKGLVPPFHPKGKKPGDYKSYWGAPNTTEVKQK
jgi:hypothetical protein